MEQKIPPQRERYHWYSILNVHQHSPKGQLFRKQNQTNTCRGRKYRNEDQKDNHLCLISDIPSHYTVLLTLGVALFPGTLQRSK
jgi:hypothetical protein